MFVWILHHWLVQQEKIWTLVKAVEQDKLSAVNLDVY